MSKKRLAILISGRGSNMLALGEAVAAGDINAEICLVLSNDKSAGGLTKARELGLPTQVIQRQDFASRAEFDAALLAALNQAQPDLVVLAGFMHILGDELVAAYYGRMINIHPSLLPKYPGLDTHRRVLAAGDKEHGLSIHYVSSQLDAGPIIMQRQIEILPADDAQTLAERLLLEEHKCLVEVVALITQGRIKLDAASGQVLLEGRALSAPILYHS